ncbi:PTS sugar transporter subunit IIA [Virgibacillus ihumii]|uniref:PTS sugar transporter subunit IIA n=1 Tax=Virgibacillus ihumii TaxID=2686091 RepID=UPI00157C748A|nr:PTS sugar transporter subunit IIA [Virgibacillus ihumii]
MSELFFDESVILLDVDCTTKEEVLSEMSQNLCDKGLVKESFCNAVIAREGEFATGLPTKTAAVAIPHTDVEHVNQKVISIAVLKQPVEFGVMGDPDATVPVKIVFLLAMNESHSQLSLLQNLMQIFQDEETLPAIINASDKTEIKAMVDQNLIYSFEGGE